MQDHEAEHLAKLAAKEALHELFLALGVDVTDPTSVQKDMAFIRNWRLSAEAIKRQSIFAIVGVVIVGLLGLIWTTLRGGG